MAGVLGVRAGGDRRYVVTSISADLSVAAEVELHIVVSLTERHDGGLAFGVPIASRSAGNRYIETRGHLRRNEHLGGDLAGGQHVGRVTEALGASDARRYAE